MRTITIDNIFSEPKEVSIEETREIPVLIQKPLENIANKLFTSFKEDEQFFQIKNVVREQNQLPFPKEIFLEIFSFLNPKEQFKSGYVNSQTYDLLSSHQILTQPYVEFIAENCPHTIDESYMNDFLVLPNILKAIKKKPQLVLDLEKKITNNPRLFNFLLRNTLRSTSDVKIWNLAKDKGILLDNELSVPVLFEKFEKSNDIATLFEIQMKLQNLDLNNQILGLPTSTGLEEEKFKGHKQNTLTTILKRQ